MNSRVIVPVDGSTRLFTVPFSFISQTHVQFACNRVIQINPLDYRWVGPSQVEFVTAPSGVLEINRRTPISNALVQFQNGAALTEQELNLAVLQNLYISQETRDYYDALIDGSLDKLITQVGGGAGAVIDKVIEEVLGSSLLADLRGRISDIDVNADTINAQRIRLDTVEEVVDALKLIEGVPIATFLQREQTARIEGDTAIAQTIDLIGAKSGDGLSFALDLTKVKVSPTESLGVRLQGIDSSIANSLAAVAQEQTARSTADSALAQQIQTLTAITDQNAAAIITESTARSNAVGSLAQQISTLHSTVNGHTASLQTIQSVTNGLAAQYMVKTDVNGYVSGFGLYNQGSTSQFIILADKFALVTPGQNPQVPFAVDANGVYMNTAYIRNLVVDKIAGGSINTQWNINNVNGRIVLDTGAFMKVIGVGFGQNGDLIEWYGPKMPITSCARSNGVTWVSTNGEAYFGGSLKAGTLYNAQRTTNTQGNAEVVVGPFDTLGRAKTIVISYGYHYQRTFNGFGGTGWTLGGGQTSATFQLQRQIGNSSWAVISQWTLTGHDEVTNEFDGPDVVVHSIGGSVTYTDNTPGTEQRTYKVVLIARSERAATHNGSGAPFGSFVSQSISIVSTEV